MPTKNPPTGTDADLNVGVRVWYEERFKELATQWKRETKFLSNVNSKCMHIAYQKIIGMGSAAVPLIINDLQTNGPNDWFWALHVITGANPITESIAGDMPAMTEAWITWWHMVARGTTRGKRRMGK